MHFCYRTSRYFVIENPARAWLWSILALLVSRRSDSQYSAWFNALLDVDFQNCEHGDDLVSLLFRNLKDGPAVVALHRAKFLAKVAQMKSELKFEEARFHAQTLWDETMKEKEKGFVKGPFESLDEVRASLGIDHDVVVTRRFVLLQGSGPTPKPRVIDDAKESMINSAYSVLEMLSLHDLDFNAALALTLGGLLYPKSPMTVELKNGQVLEGMIHPSLVGDLSVWGRCLDLSKAFKQVPIASDSLGPAVLLVHDPVTSKPRFFTTQSMPFGCTASVYSFNRITRSLLHLMRHGLRLWGGVFYDDFALFEMKQMAANASRAVSLLLDALGWRFARDEDKVYVNGWLPTAALQVTAPRTVVYPELHRLRHMGFRSVVSLALLDLTRDESMEVTIREVGALNAKGQLAYALGKLLGGPVVDAIGGGKSLLAILLLLFGSFTAMARSPTAGAKLTTSFAVSRAATAAVWTACAVALRNAFSGPGLAQALSIGQVAMRVGASSGSVFGGWLLSRVKSWRKLLMAYATLGALTSVGLALQLILRGTVRTTLRPKGTADDVAQRKIAVLPVGRSLALAAQMPRLWLLFGSTTMITPTFDFVALLPQFLHDVYQMNDLTIGSLSGAFPLSAPPAILLATAVLPRLTMNAKAASLLVAQSCSAMAFFLLSKQPKPTLLMPALIAISGGCAPALSCVPPDWIMRWGGPRAGLFAGLHDVPGNLLAMWIYSQVPKLLERGGWPLVLRLYGIQVAIGALCLCAFQSLEASNPTLQSPFG
ncbi:Uncharacterized protein (Fragment) [Durusdinium trenchii]|uniref:Uncharacterized protein n=1 Tax=Durusdinium trenchii TaxID=1381693 RepID=A0ABP0HL02_9DINO